MNTNLERILTEIGVKSNTIKMYEKTLADIPVNESTKVNINLIMKEKLAVEEELNALLKKANEFASETNGGAVGEQRKWAVEEFVENYEEKRGKLYEYDEEELYDKVTHMVGNEVDEITKDDSDGDLPKSCLQKVANENREKQMSLNKTDKYEISFDREELNELISNATWINVNGFVVDMPNELPIPSWRIRSVSDDGVYVHWTKAFGERGVATGQLTMNVNDYVDGEFILYKQLLKMRTSAKEGSDFIGDIYVKIVSAKDNKVYYTVKYKGCSLYGFKSNGSLNYDSDELRTLTLKIKYADCEVVDETTNKKG